MTLFFRDVAACLRAARPSHVASQRSSTTIGFLPRTSMRVDLASGSMLVGTAIAAGIKKAYAPLFAANESANDLDAATLKGLIAQVTGANADTVSKTLGTLQALLKRSDFKSSGASGNSSEKPAAPTPVIEANSDRKETNADTTGHRSSGMRPEFHYNIQIHLPANATEETYLHIFNAMRKAFIT